MGTNGAGGVWLGSGTFSITVDCLAPGSWKNMLSSLNLYGRLNDHSGC